MTDFLQIKTFKTTAILDTLVILSDPQFAAMMKKAEKHLGFPYGWSGASLTTSFDCSGCVSYALNHYDVCWDVGRLGSSGLLSICIRMSSSNVHPGDLVFFEEY